jgi:hypothetical protein
MSSIEICQFCNSSLKDKYALKSHLLKNKNCLKTRGLSLQTKFVCKGCKNVFPSNINLNIHINICKDYSLLKVREEYTQEFDKLRNEIVEKDKIINELQTHHVNSEKVIYDAQIQIQTLLKVLDELFITRKVQLYNEKSGDEIDTDYKTQITTLKTTLDTNKEQYQKLLNKHNSSLKTHRYIKFKKSDPCFYIIDSGVDCDCLCYKFGITGLDQGNNIDDRLRCHRTLWPKLKVRYLLFIKDVEVIEKNFKMMFEKEINPNGHEIIEGVAFDEMIKRIEKLFDILCIKEYHIMPEEKLKEYNDYVETTIKAI